VWQNSSTLCGNDKIVLIINLSVGQIPLTSVYLIAFYLRKLSSSLSTKWTSLSNGYEEIYLLGHNTVYPVEGQRTFRRKISPPSAISRNKASKEASTKQAARGAYSALFSFLARLIFRPWEWRWDLSPKLPLNFNQVASRVHAASFWLLAWIVLRPWRWKWHVPSKRPLPFNGQYYVISHRTLQ
jgi:hypothetical protein